MGGMVTLYIGSYTPDSSGGGSGVGISRLAADPGSGALRADGPVTPVPGPSYLAWHPSGRFLYATSECPDGAVSAFAVAGAELRPLGSRPTGGADPCHLSVDPTGRWLVTANYTSGSVAVHPIGDDGALGERTALVQHTGSGPVADRQEGPHAHQARFDPTGEYLLVNDLGTDTITTYGLAGGTLAAVTATSLPPGTGPRHLVFTGNRVHVAGELASTVTTFDYRAGALSPVGSVPSTAHRRGGDNFPSEIAASADARFVYVANRGEDTVTAFAAGDTGLTAIAEVPCGGEWPRHLALAAGHLYVANQYSGDVAIFRLDPDTGIPAQTGSHPLPSPACVLPV